MHVINISPTPIRGLVLKTKIPETRYERLLSVTIRLSGFKKNSIAGIIALLWPGKTKTALRRYFV